MNGYDRNATVEWFGKAIGQTGTYVGSGNIRILLNSQFRDKMEITSVSTRTEIIQQEGDYWVVNSTFDFRGHSSILGSINETVSARDSFSHVGDSLLIVREIWNYTVFDVQFPFT